MLWIFINTRIKIVRVGTVYSPVCYLACRWLPSRCVLTGGESDLCLAPPYKPTDPIMKAPLPWHHRSLVTPQRSFYIYHHIGVRASTYELGEEGIVHSRASSNIKRLGKRGETTKEKYVGSTNNILIDGKLRGEGSSQKLKKKEYQGKESGKNGVKCC